MGKIFKTALPSANIFACEVSGLSSSFLDITGLLDLLTDKRSDVSFRVQLCWSELEGLGLSPGAPWRPRKILA